MSGLETNLWCFHFGQTSSSLISRKMRRSVVSFFIFYAGYKYPHKIRKSAAVEWWGLFRRLSSSRFLRSLKWNISWALSLSSIFGQQGENHKTCLHSENCWFATFFLGWVLHKTGNRANNFYWFSQPQAEKKQERRNENVKTLLKLQRFIFLQRSFKLGWKNIKAAMLWHGDGSRVCQSMRLWIYHRPCHADGHNSTWFFVENSFTLFYIQILINCFDSSMGAKEECLRAACDFRAKIKNNHWLNAYFVSLSFVSCLLVLAARKRRKK